MTVRFIVGDALSVMREMEAGSVDLVCSSPPFLAVRSYLPSDHPDKGLEMGSEATPADFLDALLDVTEEAGRVLGLYGSLCFELGDTYAGSGGAGGDYSENGLREGQEAFDGSGRRGDKRIHGVGHASSIPARRVGSVAYTVATKGNGWPMDKSLCGIPTLYANSLAYGRNLLRPERETPPWRIRNLRAWVRNNPPVGALGDKFRPATSYIIIACKAKNRWFDLDAVRNEGSPNTHARTAKGVQTRLSTGKTADDEHRGGNFSSLDTLHDTNGAPPLDWVLVNPKGYSGAHYAVYPEALLHELIESMCPRRVCRTCGKPSRRIVEVTGLVDQNGREVEPEVWQSGMLEGKGAHSNKQTSGTTTTTTTTTGWTSCGCPNTAADRLDGYHEDSGWRPGVVLDPFGGSGTTAVVAASHSRDCILIDLDQRNEALARDRLGMFLDL